MGDLYSMEKKTLKEAELKLVIRQLRQAKEKFRQALAEGKMFEQVKELLTEVRELEKTVLELKDKSEKSEDSL